MPPEEWGVTTQNEGHVYLHIFSKPPVATVFIPGHYDAKKFAAGNTGKAVVVSTDRKGITLDLSRVIPEDPVTILTLPRIR
jgi:hypothetical protein